MRKVNLTGQRFGRLVVITEVGRSNGRVLWKCRCDCGNETVVRSSDVLSGNTTSCGCLKRELVTKHGLRRHPLYGVWGNMMQRTGVYKGADGEVRRNYMERGISICDEWETFENFYNWSIEHGYSKGLQIDRIDNDRGYCPENCRWVTRKQNVNNRRNTRVLCGCSLAMLCSDLGIETLEDGGTSKAYDRICHYHTRHSGQKVHRELVFAMSRDIEKQERLLAQARSIREEWETKIALLKERLKSASLVI